jgi:hypothetical protein
MPSNPETTTKDRSEVEVLFTDFNGSSWDGSPFSHCPPWLMAAITTQRIVPVPDDRDYSPFNVQTKDGPVIAYCGDRIGFDGEHLYVKRAR